MKTNENEMRIFQNAGGILVCNNCCGRSGNNEMLLIKTKNSNNYAWSCNECYEEVKDWGTFEIVTVTEIVEEVRRIYDK